MRKRLESKDIGHEKSRPLFKKLQYFSHLKQSSLQNAQIASLTDSETNKARHSFLWILDFKSLKEDKTFWIQRRQYSLDINYISFKNPVFESPKQKLRRPHKTKK